jgi:hypothetical protein
MKVKVLVREVHYGGRGRLRGEVFEADERWTRGRLLLRQIEEVANEPLRKAHVEPPPAPPPAPEPEPEPEVQPEPEAVAELAPEPEPEPPPVVIRPPDNDGDGRPGGKLSKDRIIEELTRREIKHDPDASWSKLNALLKDARAGED